MDDYNIVVYKYCEDMSHKDLFDFLFSELTYAQVVELVLYCKNNS